MSGKTAKVSKKHLHRENQCRLPVKNGVLKAACEKCGLELASTPHMLA